jgi:2'-5' RNA ligase
VQRGVVGVDQRIAPAIVPAEKLHVTLAMLRLDTIAEKEAAVAAMSAASTLVARMMPQMAKLRFQGVGCFRDRVLHAQLHPVDSAIVAAFVTELLHLFEAHRVALVGNRAEYIPHMTIAKLSRQLTRDMGMIDPSTWSAWASMSFGEQHITGMHLLELGRDVYGVR